MVSVCLCCLFSPSCEVRSPPAACLFPCFPCAQTVGVVDALTGSADPLLCAASVDLGAWLDGPARLVVVSQSVVRLWDRRAPADGGLPEVFVSARARARQQPARRGFLLTARAYSVSPRLRNHLHLRLRCNGHRRIGAE